MDDEEEFKKFYGRLGFLSRSILSITSLFMHSLGSINFLLKGGNPRDVISMFNIGNRYSLPLGSLISNPLYVAGPENIEWHKSIAGRYSSVRYIPKMVTESDMVVGGYCLDDFKDMPPDVTTPSMPYTPLSLDCQLGTEFNALEKLLEYEFIVRRTYSKAYDNIFPGNSIIQDNLSIMGIGNAEVYQVTPKGNSLVLLFLDGGNRKKKPEKDYILKPA